MVVVVVAAAVGEAAAAVNRSSAAAAEPQGWSRWPWYLLTPVGQPLDPDGRLRHVLHFQLAHDVAAFSGIRFYEKIR